MTHRIRIAGCIVATALAMAGILGAPAAASEEYLLGPQDKVRLKVHEWRPSLGQFFDWPALNDEFTVSASGTLSLPFVGDVPVAGLAPAKAGALIGEHLMRGLQLGRRPHAAVEVVAYRPIYVTGIVANPGEHAYRPGLNVLQAVSLAGGLRRADSDSLQTELERDAIAAAGELDILALGADDLLARRARLAAELSDSDSITFPAELVRREQEPEVALIRLREEHIFQTRREAFANQLRALEELQAHLDKEEESLEAQLAVETQRLKLIRDELTDIASLVSRGLVAAPRRLELERLAAQVEGERLRAGSNLMRSRQERTRTEIAILELRNQRVNEASVELRQVENTLRESETRSETARQQLLRTRSVALDAGPRRSSDAEPLFVIVRPHGNEVVELPATEGTKVRPDDIVKVELRRGSGATPFASSHRRESGLPDEPAATPRPHSDGRLSSRTGPAD